MSEHVMNRMTEEEYRKSPAVNKSTLWEIRKSPAHYKWAVDHQDEQEDTQALRMGRAIHMAILQPDEYLDHYAVAPNVDRRTKEGKKIWEEFLAENEGCEVLSQDEFDTIKEISKSVVRETPMIPWWAAETEVPLFWDDPRTGIRCKCRVDAIVPLRGQTIVIDLKTTTDASSTAFVRDALRFGYHVQAAHYLNGIKAARPELKNPEWWFVAVEKKPPYAVNVLKADDGFLDAGQFKLMELMDKLDDCMRIDQYPGYGTNTIVMPAWATGGDDE